MNPPVGWTSQGVTRSHRNALVFLVLAIVLEVAGILTLLTVVLTSTSTGALMAAVGIVVVVSLLTGLAFINYARARMWATMAGAFDGALRGGSSGAPRHGGPGGSGGSGYRAGPGGLHGGPGSGSWSDPTWETPWYDQHHHHGHHSHHDHGGWSGGGDSGWSDSGSSSSDCGSSSSSDSGSSSSSSSSD